MHKDLKYETLAHYYRNNLFSTKTACPLLCNNHQDSLTGILLLVRCHLAIVSMPSNSISFFHFTINVPPTSLAFNPTSDPTAQQAVNPWTALEIWVLSFIAAATAAAATVVFVVLCQHLACVIKRFMSTLPTTTTPTTTFTAHTVHC